MAQSNKQTAQIFYDRAATLSSQALSRHWSQLTTNQEILDAKLALQSEVDGFSLHGVTSYPTPSSPRIKPGSK